MKEKESFGVFFREKPALMLLGLHNAKAPVYASSLAKSVDCTYSHVVKILQHMEDSIEISYVSIFFGRLNAPFDMFSFYSIHAGKR